MDEDPFRSQLEDKDLLGLDVSYVSAFRALMYLANYTCPDISFYVNLLTRYSFSPTQRYWNEVKHILRYHRGTIDMGLFYSRVHKLELVSYANANYLLDPYNGGTTIS